MVLAIGLCSCGGGSKSGGGSASGSESASGLEDGKWPAAVYEKYGIPEIETKGKIVYTELTGEESSYMYRVDYKGVTKEEMQAWVKQLEEKGFRIPKYTKERFDAGRSDLDAIVYLPEQGKDKGLRIAYDFQRDMDKIHEKLADVFAAKGVKCYHTFSGKEMTAEELKAQKIRSYVVEKDGQKYQMMGMSDDRIGDFGGGIDFRFMKSNK